MVKLSCPSWLKEMPKTDLHCHLGGSVRLNTLLELADNNGVDLVKLAAERGLVLPTISEESLRLMIDGCVKKKSLVDYLRPFHVTEGVFKKAVDFERAAYEVSADAHSENVKIFELRFAPTRYESDALHLYEIVEATLSGLEQARKDFQMETGLIICGIRNQPDNTRKAVEIAVSYHGRGVIGFDLAGPEHGHRPKDFEEIIMPVLFNFLPVTIHAGEDDTVASIAEAMIYLNARRIGHGKAVLESTKLLEYINKTRTTLEICYTSNVDTAAAASYGTHPTRRFLWEDLRTCVNTDNRTISNTTVTREYLALMSHLGFTQDDVFKLAKDGIKSAFLDSKIMKHYLDEFDKYVAGVKNG